MSKITHAATRAAFGTAIDGVLKYVSRDRKEHMMKLVDLETPSASRLMMVPET